ncbi:hypothetical protein SKAU_G00285500 [Synaphobranchus kaupii]|uniref:Annexin n=1 Tax=Synaphobranchus kaupii TaxID=118154 RepID=A0A9Q1EXW7_SYNKA|nr:hypothetical protein SKAU_G00285500 [Synaphobranchus kaupii]
MTLLKDLFRRVVDLGSDDEEDASFHGTVGPDPLFLASEDASFLDRAITAEGVEEGAILARLVKRNCEQRQQIKEAFQQAYGKALDADLGTALSGDLKDLALALLKTPAQYDAQMLREAMKGFGTNEDVLIEILVSRSNAEIAEIKKVYQEEYQRDLEEDIDSENR